MRRRDLLARLNFASEIGGGVLVLGAMGWAVWRGAPLPLAGAALGFVVFALALTLWSRRGDPGLLTETPQAVLRSAIGQARTGVRWAYAGVAISLAGMVFLTLVLLVLGSNADEQHRTVAGALVFMLVCIGFYLRHARRCRRRMAAHQAALAALTDLGGATSPPDDRI